MSEAPWDWIDENIMPRLNTDDAVLGVSGMTLKEALDHHAGHMMVLSGGESYTAAWLVVAAARRFLALTETGPDYEAAAKALYNAKPEVVSGSWPRWEDLRSAARALHLDNAKAVVDAALADYLTEEET